MFTVIKGFSTQTKRLHPGDPVSVDDCHSVEHFDRLVELGHIGKAKPESHHEPAPEDDTV